MVAITQQTVLLDDQYVAVNNNEQFISSPVLNQQIQQLLRAGQTPVLYLNEATHLCPLPFAEWLANRLSNILEGIKAPELSQVVLAYRPQWVIGPLDQPQTWQLVINARLIREVITDLYGQAVGQRIQVVCLEPHSNTIIDEVKNDMKINYQLVRK